MEQSSFWMGKRTPVCLLIAILLLGLSLRLNGLGAKSLWQDEIGTLKHVASGGVSDLIWSVLDKTLPAPPLHFLLVYLFSFLGSGDFLLRFPSAIFGILGVTAAYKLGEALFGRREGLLAAFLLALSPLHVRYSQEARAYALFMLLSAWALFSLWKGMRGGETKWWVGFIISNVLNLYTHLFALLVLLAEALIFSSLLLWGFVGRRPEARSKVGRAFLCVLGIMAIIAACYLPMVSHLWRAIHGDKGLGGMGFTPGISPTLAFFAGVFGLFGTGGGAALLIFAACFLTGLVASFKKQTNQGLLALLWIGVPFGVLFAFPAKHGFRPRYLIFILPLYLVFVSHGVSTLGRLISDLPGYTGGVRRHGFYAAWLLFFLLFAVLGFRPLRNYYGEQRVDWRLAAKFLVRNVAVGEVVFSQYRGPAIVLSHYEDELAEVPFVQGGHQGVDPATVQREGGIWFVRDGWSALPLAQEVRGSRDDPIFQVVFGADPDHRSRAMVQSIAPAMLKEIWIAYYREGVEVEELITLYEDALSLATPHDSVDIENSLGDLLFQEGRIDEAVFHYQEAIDLAPDAPHAHHGLAQAYEEKGWSQLAAREREIYRELTGE